ncbi:MAG: PDDEXK nuclease domain-containing protein [Nanoarchaeota archaeon]|nr:PDDEXK nuclease domain-containing protein [Nanoarchaeota archaeon]
MQKKNYVELVKNIEILLKSARKTILKSVNLTLIRTYWEVGEEIVQFEQKNKERAEYGSRLLNKLSEDLRLKCGRGFSKSNVYLMRLFYLKYKKFQTVSGKLSGSHYVELLVIDEDSTRSFYEKQCLRENWSIRELQRQKKSLLFERLAFKKNKKEVSALVNKGKIEEKEEDIVKDPYILEFLGLPEKYTERQLEQKIIENLQKFLLELGKGFTFVSRQYRITLNNTHFYVDLVFYHRILKCFVLIDLKLNKVNHTDIGQMNMYLNYFKEEINTKEDSAPVGIILSTEKDSLFIKYALGGISNKLFVSKYKVYLPKKEELEKEIGKMIN